MDRIAKLLSRIPKKHRRQVLEVLECLGEVECRPTLRAEKITGSKSLFRVRAGRYRIIFHVDEYNYAIVDDIRLRNEGTYKGI